MNWPMVMLLYSGKSVTNIQNTYLHFNRLSSPGHYFYHCSCNITSPDIAWEHSPDTREFITWSVEL